MITGKYTAGYVIIFSFILIISACKEYGRGGDPKQSIGEHNVIGMEIRKSNTNMHDTLLHRKQMTYEERKTFITQYNEASWVEGDSCKGSPDYWVDIIYRNGSVGTLIIHGNYLKYDNDNCFCFQKKNYIQKLWNEIK